MGPALQSIGHTQQNSLCTNLRIDMELALRSIIGHKPYGTTKHVCECMWGQRFSSLKRDALSCSSQDLIAMKCASLAKHYAQELALASLLLLEVRFCECRQGV